MDLRNRFFQLVVHRTIQNGASDIIAKVERAYEQDVYAWHLSYGINLESSAISAT